MFDAQVIRKGMRDYPNLLRGATAKFLTEAAIIVQADAKRESPKDTHNLEGSIVWRIEGNTAIVGTNVEYAQHQEYGTRRMKAQPYMRPAIDKNRKKLIKRFADMIRSILRG